MVNYTDQWTLINKSVLNGYLRKTISKSINSDLNGTSQVVWGPGEDEMTQNR